MSTSSESETFDVTASIISTAELTVGRFIDRTTPGNVGVALSGGGSRAAAAAMGQLRGLHALGLLDEVRAISSVSGGSWLAGAWMFLPGERSDDDFLGHYVADPGALVLGAEPGTPPGADLDEVLASCFAHAITQPSFDAARLALGLSALEQRGMPRQRAWQSLVGDLLYRPLGLHDVDDQHRPRTFFAFDRAAVDAARAANPERLPAVAHMIKQPNEGEARRPFYICNAGMEVLDAHGQPAIAPVQGTPFFVGIVPELPARNAHGQAVGGGGVTPFAFGGALVDRSKQEPGTITARQEAVFSLSDMVGISSAFYADLLFGMNQRIDMGRRESIVPRYGYFRPAADPPAGDPCHFVDGGGVENLGIAALLGYDDIDAIVAFVNPSEALGRSRDGLDLIVVDQSIPPLFGYQPYRKGVGYLPYDASAPSIPEDAVADGEVEGPGFRHNRVFPESAFRALLDGLWAATTAGGDTPGVGPCAYLQRDLAVQDNAWFGVRRRTVDVMWFSLNPASAWTQQLEPRVARHLPRHWPNYPTTDTGLSARAVNYLAHFAAWGVVQSQAELHALFGRR
jgi:hypothetical protein